MIVRSRKIDGNSVITNPMNRFPYSQASINSDGCLTIRNYDKTSKENEHTDEIIVLTKTETDAVFQLFDFLNKTQNRYKLPF